MVVTCVIEFDNNPFGTYYAGQVMTGKVTLQIEKPEQVKGVVLKIIGSADTSWTEKSSYSTTDLHGHTKTETNLKHYYGHEDYIKSKTYLLASDENQLSVIEPGIHIYSFSCQIPHNCPTSFEGIYGHIRYIVKVELVRPWKFDKTFTRGFTVLKVMDLNYDSPLLRVPCHTGAQKVFCCGPCKTQPLDIHVSVPQVGYVPGQSIPVGVLITNDTNIKIEEIKVELVMLICFYSTTPSTKTKNQRIVVTKMLGEGVPVHCKKQFNYPLDVPATPPTCFNLCRILQIAYQVEVTAKVKGWHVNQVVCLPVTVGNVPLMSVIQTQPTAIARSAAPNDAGTQGALQSSATSKQLQSDDATTKSAIGSNGLKTSSLNDAAQPSSFITASSEIIPAPLSPWSADASIPPPTYEAAVHMKPAKINNGEAHDYGESEFAPRYPVFKIPSPDAPGIDEVDIVDAPGRLASNDITSVTSNTAKKSTWL